MDILTPASLVSQHDDSKEAVLQSLPAQYYQVLSQLWGTKLHVCSCNTAGKHASPLPLVAAGAFL